MNSNLEAIFAALALDKPKKSEVEQKIQIKGEIDEVRFYNNVFKFIQRVQNE